MDYEIAYIEILEKLRKFLDCWRNYPPDNNSYEDVIDDLEYRFPELKESEDERIKKEIIGFLNAINKDQLEARNFIADRYGDAIPDDMIPTWITWLEKQGEQNPPKADSIPLDCTSDAKNENTWHKVEDSLPDNAREVLCKDAIGNFFIGRYYNDGDYWEVSMYDEPDKSNKDNPPVIMWANIPSCEQNLANSTKTCEVEPKFKVGDWIVYNVDICQIVKREEGCNKLVTNFGIEKELVNERNLSTARLWTIQDAKDGDVLVASDGSILLFKCVVDAACKHYIALTTDNAVKFNEGLEHYWETSRAVHPATQEQCNLLFQKMKEAGYEWDADKKKLRKIEQKPTWSKEDEHRITDTIYFLDTAKKHYASTEELHACIEWLKSLKERYT